MTELVKPFIDLEFEENISLEPYQMFSDYNYYLLQNLKTKLENKCNKFGYINRINNIIKASSGLLECGDFSANATYRVKYNANTCKPVKGNIIIVKFEFEKYKNITASNGPIIGQIELVETEDSKFTFNNKGEITYKKDQHVLSPTDYLKIEVNNILFYLYNEYIMISGHIVDLATEDEIKDYYINMNIINKVKNKK